MALELFKHYFSYWIFSLIHIGLVVAAVWTFVRGRRVIRLHLESLGLHPRSDPGNGSFEPDRTTELTQADPWLDLQRLHASPRRPAFSEVREQYSTLIGGYTEVLARLVNVLLLTGVAGTLYGLYSGTKTANGAITWNDALPMFHVFVVTIAAVVLAGGVIGLQQWMARFCDRAEVSISLMWAAPATLDAEGPAANVAAVIDPLKRLIEQFTPIVDRMREHSDRILQDGESLSKVAASCDRLKQTVEELPASLHEVATRSHEVYLKGLRDNAEAAQRHHDSALGSVQRIAASAGEAHATYLQALRDNASAVQKHHESTLGDVQRVAAAAGEAHATYLAILRDNAAAVQKHHESALGGMQQLTSSAQQAHTMHLEGLAHVQHRNEELFEQVCETNRRAFKMILEDIANFSERIQGIDRSAQTVIAEFGNQLTRTLLDHISTLDARLATLLDVAPNVERNLQQLQPSSEAAARSVKGVETVSVEAIGQVQGAVKALASQVQDAAKGLAGSLARAQTQLDRVVATQQAIARPAPEPEPAPEKRGAARPAVVVGLAGLAACVGTVLTWVLLRVAS